jgi:excisionase family DNA binding protein
MCGVVTRDAALGEAVIDALGEQALERLAVRLSPYLEASHHELSAGGWLDAREAAAYLGLSLDALHKLTAARSIPFEQDGPGCKLWFQRSELDRWRRAGGSESHRSASTPLPRQHEAAS